MGPMTGEQMNKTNSGVQKIRDQLAKLGDKVKEEIRREQKRVDGIEKSIQLFLAYARGALSDTVTEFDLMYSKNRQNEELIYKKWEAFDTATSDLKEIVTNMFDNLREID